MYGFLLSDPRVAAQLVVTIVENSCYYTGYGGMPSTISIRDIQATLSLPKPYIGRTRIFRCRAVGYNLHIIGHDARINYTNNGKIKTFPPFRVIGSQNVGGS